MTNKYLEKIAEQADRASAGEIVRSAISPAWGRANVAKKHGAESDSFGSAVGHHVGGAFRAAGRSFVESVAGGGIGAAVGAGAGLLSRGHIHPGAIHGGAAVGSNVGAIHGVLKSYKNQMNEAHEEYSKKAKKD